ncbi:MAG: ferrous iron transport protein B [Prevotella sp.]|nr:ferrous iron transport protein B [Prevotella sp.]
MKLSELKTGEHGVIVKVHGHGGFRKRIIEMGFVRGKLVEVLLNAPLHDPVKYKLMGYEVSLRRQEAELIEVVSEQSWKQETAYAAVTFDASDHPDDYLRHEALRQRRTINVALIGNPNCGKTSLFNFASGAHGHVGNYSGVTVDASSAHAEMFGYEFNLIDLPGTYSLSCYSPEELYVRRYLTDQMPDVVINVIDASNLERNLYLTTQLMDMDLRVVCALNMYDEFERRGDYLDTDKLSTLLGIPMVPTSFKNGMGVKDLFRSVIQVYEGKSRIARHLHINYGHELENGIARLQKYLKPDEKIHERYSTRYLAIKLLEGDSSVERLVVGDASLLEVRDRAAARVLEETGDDAETAIMDAKYGFINGALTEAGFTTGTKEDTYRMTHIIDNVLSNRFVGFPIFFAILFVMFQTTFALGQYPMDWIEAGVDWLGGWLEQTLPGGSVRSMLVDGVIGGVGSVIVFLPQILILYFFISLMEDSGYMARAAFIMDRLMHKMGLHGKSFIPLVMGFGCNVPAVMATRTIESRRSRLITMLILPFMSCSARLPVYIMITGTFFAAQWRSWVMISLYAIGILLSVIVSNVLSSFVIRGEDTPFVMELPPYRWPTPKAIGRHTWEKGKEYLKKMGGIILVASIIVWALGYFPHDDSLTVEQQQEQSYIGRMGKTIEPVFSPQGFNWKLDVSLIAGIGAKEIVASTIGVLYSGTDDVEDQPSTLNSQPSTLNPQISNLKSQPSNLKADLTPLTAYCFLLFILIYFPCIATIAAIKHETGSWRWATVAAVYTTVLAWIVSALVHQLGQLFL